MPNIKKHATDSKQDVGNLTKQSIEENRKLLSEMKEEARNQTYGN